MAERKTDISRPSQPQPAEIAARDTIGAIFAPLDALTEGSLTADEVHRLMELQRFHTEATDLGMTLEEYEELCRTSGVVQLRKHHSNRALLEGILAEDTVNFQPNDEPPGSKVLSFRRSSGEEDSA